MRRLHGTACRRRRARVALLSTIGLGAFVAFMVAAGNASIGSAGVAAAQYEYGPAFAVSPAAQLSADRKSVTITGTVRCEQGDSISFYPFGVAQVVGRRLQSASTGWGPWIYCDTAGTRGWSLTTEPLAGAGKLQPGPATVTGFYGWWHAATGMSEAGQVNTAVRLVPR